MSWKAPLPISCILGPPPPKTQRSPNPASELGATGGQGNRDTPCPAPTLRQPGSTAYRSTPGSQGSPVTEGRGDPAQRRKGGASILVTTCTDKPNREPGQADG